MYVSSNNGTSWKIINEGLPQYSSGNCINTIAINGENIFIGTGSNWNGGVYMLPKNSSSWILKGLTYYGSINATTVNGTNIFIGTGGDYGGGGILISSDNGITGAYVNTGLPLARTLNNEVTTCYDNITSLFVSGNNLFAETETRGIFLSTNNGTSWTAVNNGLSMYNSVVWITTIGNNLYAGFSADIFQSTNNGANWTSWASRK